MVKVRTTLRVTQFKWAAGRQRLAPQDFVISPERWAEGVGVLSKRVDPKIK
jgi:hypothetical protein